jgi:hypothetical protein
MIVKKGGYIKHDLVLSLVNVLYLCAPDNHNFLQKTKEKEGGITGTPGVRLFSAYLL